MRRHTLSIFLFLCVFTALPLCLGRVKGVTSSLKKALHVKGSGDVKTTNMTALQMHASFFDRDKDGIITMKETYQGMRALGYSYAISVASALFINGALSRKTRPPETPATITLPIYINNIKNGKHGSDTDAYDSNGRFVPKKFEKILKKYAKTNPNALTEGELDNMLQGNKDAGDTTGQIAARAEWNLLYRIAKDKDGLLQKDTVRGVYDGSLFFKLEQKRLSSKNKKT
ncbi:Caleosin-related family protein [Rhynchospora pubera]|uniref:Caleosin-related family protein n=1 Tax=Rhynchospora pubera TaxID=906938 RepID=A0AAV8HFU2_9POAL|nr:Caleosin-related family protein [Rhynchospora pubera]